jgi:pseudouridine synthase
MAFHNSTCSSLPSHTVLNARHAVARDTVVGIHPPHHAIRGMHKLSLSPCSKCVIAQSGGRGDTASFPRRRREQSGTASGGSRRRVREPGPRKYNPDNINVIRLNKALASMGLASRRGADTLIQDGRISVNGVVVQEAGVMVNIAKDEIKFDGKIMTKTAVTNKYYFAMNKPKGYICTNARDGEGGSGDRLVVDLFDGWISDWKRKHPNSSLAPRLFTVGRLDVQSVGLIFVTNDGDWAHAVQHPSSGLTKEYSVTLNKRPGKVELEKMSRGYFDKDANVQVVPVAVALDDSDASKRNRVRIIVAEGRNREVRNIVEEAGMDVKVLRRIRVGGYRIPRDLAFGRFVELKPHEVRRILNVGADRSM